MKKSTNTANAAAAGTVQIAGQSWITWEHWCAAAAASLHAASATA